MDVVRSQLLAGDEGISLGLLTAKFRFIDISYLVSHDFRAGTLGFKSLRLRLSFMLPIGTSALISVFAGPSTALLLIPTWHEAWPAGSSKFWINGDLQPSMVDRSSSWDPICSDPTMITGQTSSINSSVASCIWAGYPYLAEAFRQRATSGERTLSYSDGSFRRDITLNWGVPDSDTPSVWLDTARVAAYASNLAIGAFSQYMSQEWCTALFHARETGAGKLLSNLRYRAFNSTKGSVKGQVPVTRAQCFEADSYLPEPVLRNEQPQGQVLLPFPIIPNFSGRRDLRYYIPVRYLNTSELVTHWISMPTGFSQTNYGEQINRYPSGFLVIQNYNFGYRKSAITCSVHADWVSGTNVASGLCWGQQRSIQQRAVLDDVDSIDLWSITSQQTPDRPVFNAANGWHKINTTTNWLESLTPKIQGSSTNQTTLASVIEQTQSRDGESGAVGQVKLDRFITISVMVASFVSDGLSRIGYTENYADDVNEDRICNGDSPSCPWNWDRWTWSQIWSDLIRGRAELHPDETHRQPGKSYIWYATVAGYGIRATSTAYYLALTVLYIYLVLVITHVAYIFSKKGQTSDSWSSLTDLLVLSQTSPAPQGLQNTSSGVKSHATMKLKMRVKANNAVPIGKEKLQLLVGSDGLAPSLKRVTPEEKYGAQT
ncbi:unnamed protein product [Alternaria sp. RS040]